MPQPLSLSLVTPRARMLSARSSLRKLLLTGLLSPLFHPSLMARPLSLRSLPSSTLSTTTLRTGPTSLALRLVTTTLCFGVPFAVGVLCNSADILANASAAGSIKKPGRPHLLRWYTQVEAQDAPRQLLESFAKARSSADKGRKEKRTETIEAVLPNAVEGKVVVRFGG